MNTVDSAGSRAAGRPILDTVEVTTGPEPTAAVVWLHGLGADGHDFEPIVPFFQWPDGPSIRFVFPHAPARPVTINGGMRMRAWYDIRALQIDRDQDVEAIEESTRQAADLVRREQERGIDAGRIVVAGFSQGGAIAIQCALRYPDRLAGLIARATYLPLESRLESERHEVNHGLPVFFGHGVSDPVVPVGLGHHAIESLRALDYEVEAHDYPMQHAVCPDEISHISAWLKKRF